MVQEVLRKPQCIPQIPKIVGLKAFSWEWGLLLDFILVLVTFVITNRSCSEQSSVDGLMSCLPCLQRLLFTTLWSVLWKKVGSRVQWLDWFWGPSALKPPNICFFCVTIFKVINCQSARQPPTLHRFSMQQIVKLGKRSDWTWKSQFQHSFDLKCKLKTLIQYKFIQGFGIFESIIYLYL